MAAFARSNCTSDKLCGDYAPNRPGRGFPGPGLGDAPSSVGQPPGPIESESRSSGDARRDRVGASDDGDDKAAQKHAQSAKDEIETDTVPIKPGLDFPGPGMTDSPIPDGQPAAG